ncbi:von Willebrand factor type A domain protein [Botrimarina colliarenosi]|uniref:von Willebrand factor type A domain protein n=1 Tax=Botrimarina colliarenosi TaxID=2528001 RepID=A0A5C6AIG3_9BACT|nr:VWA domain-containing protein [Botrimarina colliarenosi]TWT99419.1 von Willebrand factor type A domain protein [Botrimarina colliarenosi]
MFSRSLAFDSPWWLALLALLPVLWALSYRGLSGLGTWRRFGALAFRSIVFTLVVFALADAQFRKTTDRVTVLYLLDQSLSIPEAQREAMRSLVNGLVREHRRDDKQDRAGVVVFGADSEVEIPPIDFNYEMSRIESLVDRRATNLAGAMERAMSLFPYDSAKRVVLVTDGNENAGDALRQARAMADAGVSVDVLPTPLIARSETAVDKIALPSDVRLDQPFEARIVIDHQADAGSSAKGQLRIVRKTGDVEQVISEGPVTLKPGKNVFSVRETIDRADFYTYEARFVPDNAAGDASAQNNVATAFTHVRGKGQVLFIEDWEHPGEFDRVVDGLQREGLEVTLRQSNQLFANLAELQRYDSVVLANTPRTSGFGDDLPGEGGVTVVTDALSGFSDEQVEMLVRNTEELGCGLVMLGGDRSFGAGGWDDSPLEKAMPVDFEIKAAKVTPVGALAMIMHASEIAQGNYWQKRIAIEAVDTLGPRDYAGLLTWQPAGDQWLWGQSQGGMIPVGPSRQNMKARVDRLSVGDMPEFDPGMKVAAAAFAKLSTANPAPAIKHMIIISDGDPSPPTGATIASLKKQKVRVTTVAVGAHGPAGHSTMEQIAKQTGGKYYVVRNAAALPKIYQREARRVSRPLVRELAPAESPVKTLEHEIVRGVSENFPPTSGFVMTTLKDSSLVEVILRSPVPTDAESSTILAAWTYGLGKSVAFTTDAGARWSDAWTEWEDYDRFFSQMVRWSMRPTGDTGNFTISTDVVDGKARVVVDALDKNDEFLDLPAIGGAAVRPDLGSSPLDFRQVAPGRYVAEVEADDPGSYMIVVSPGAGQGVLRTGVNVGYSDEFRDRTTNVALLDSIAGLEAKGGAEGEDIATATGFELTGLDAANEIALSDAYDPYRRDLPPAVASQPIWPLMVLLASCVFVADVFIRRVQVNLAWVGPLLSATKRRLFGGEEREPQAETMARLRSRKAEVRETSTAAGSTRFEASDETPPSADASPLDELRTPTGATPKKPTTPPKQSLASDAKPTEEGYTSRLLKAKRDAMKDRDTKDK